MDNTGLRLFAYSNWELVHLLSIVFNGCQQEEGWILNSQSVQNVSEIAIWRISELDSLLFLLVCRL